MKAGTDYVLIILSIAKLSGFSVKKLFGKDGENVKVKHRLAV